MRSKNTEIKVGIFVLTAIAVAGALAFAIGNKSNAFRKKVPYTAVFDTVGGLRPGSPVTMAGVEVGIVREVELEQDGKIHVEFGVISEAAELVREDSVITIGSKGLLGDKLIEVIPGKGKKIPVGGLVASESPVDLGQYMTKASKIIIDAEATVENLREATEPFADPTFANDVKKTTKNLATFSEMMARKDGFMDRLTSEKSGKHLDATFANIDKLSGQVAATSDSVRAITAEIERGDGTAHELIYGQDGKKLIAELAVASQELALMMKAVRTGDGTAHDLIYGKRGNEILDNIAAVSADLRAVTADVRAGRGTIGGLLVDPSIYEDVKRLVGDLERNEILRAFVRYSIRQDESKPAAPAVEPK